MVLANGERSLLRHQCNIKRKRCYQVVVVRVTVHNLLLLPRRDVALVPAEKPFLSKLRKFLSWIFSVYRLEHGCETFKFRVSQVDVAMSSCSLMSFSKSVRCRPIQKIIFRSPNSVGCIQGKCLILIHFLLTRLNFSKPATPSRLESLCFQMFSKSVSRLGRILNLFIAMNIFVASSFFHRCST